MIEFREDKKSKKKIVYISIGIFIAIIVVTLIAIQLLKYQVEGEKNLPFEITDMLIVSTGDGIGNEDVENRWNLVVLQNNDIYIEIKEKTDENRKEHLKSVTLQNFNISNGPQKGEPKIYHPVNDKDLIYLYKDENLVQDKIEYNVASKNNIKKLELGPDGGILSFSSCSTNVAYYISNEDTEMKYDATLLNKVGISEEQLKYQINFDIIVEMESNKKYKATITLDLPLSNLLSEGTVQDEKTDFSNIIFKRL